MTWKKRQCNKHHQHLFYVYQNDKTGELATLCQVCEDEAITAGTMKIKPISQEMRLMQAEAEME